MRVPIYETIDGRVVWRMEEPPNVTINPIVATSPVSFPDEQTAKRIYILINNARREDQTGGHTWRRLLSESTMNELLGYAADMFKGCSFTGWVTRSVIGADGNNWSIHWGETDSQTKHAMHNATTRLGEQFNLTA